MKCVEFWWGFLKKSVGLMKNSGHHQCVGHADDEKPWSTLSTRKNRKNRSSPSTRSSPTSPKSLILDSLLLTLDS